MSWLGDAWDWTKDKFNTHLKPDRANNPWAPIDPEGNLGQQAHASDMFAGRGEEGFSNRGKAIDAVATMLNQRARGQDSASQEQLRQALMQSQSAQRSMAAGAAPNQQGMAARQAMNNMARQQSAMSGQAAMAGVAERQAAAQQLGALLANARQQDMQAALGGRSTAMQGFGETERARTARFQARMGTPTGQENFLNMGQSAIAAYAMSDRRVKEDVRDGSAAARKLLRALKPHTYRYRDEGAPDRPAGQHVGIMAQDLERAAPQAVIDTPRGKAVDGARLATMLAAAAADMHKRLERVEKRER